MKFLLLTVLSLSVLVPATSEAASISYEGDCGASDRWELDSSFSERERALLERLPREEAQSVKRFWQAELSRRLAKTPRERALGEYASARILYHLRAINAAQRGLVEILKKETSGGLQQVSFSCLARIHREYRALAFSSDESQVILNADPKQVSAATRADLQELRTRMFLKVLPDTKTAGDEKLAQILPTIDAGSVYGRIVASLSAAHFDDRGKAESLLNQLVGEKLPESFARYKEFAHLTLARYATASGQLDRAVEQFAAVPANSEWYPEAIAEKSWVELSRKQYESAAGGAYTSLLPAMRGVFLPDALLIAALAHLETCHAPEARRYVREIFKRYRPTYEYLRQHRSDDALYAEAINFARGKSQVPEIVGTEWTRTSVFAAVQEEINATLDEKRILSLLLQHKGDKRRANSRALLTTLAEEASQKEARLVATLNDRLRSKNEHMWAKLNRVVENARLAEIEILNSVGEERLNGKKKDLRKDSGLLAETDTWRWGRRLTSDAEKDEVWADEIGNFKVNVTNACAKN